MADRVVQLEDANGDKIFPVSVLPDGQAYIDIVESDPGEGVSLADDRFIAVVGEEEKRNAYVYRYSSTSAFTATTEKTVFSFRYIPKTDKVAINYDMPLYTSRYTSNMEVRIGSSSTEYAASTTNSTSGTARVAGAAIASVTPNEEIALSLVIRGQDSGTTATIPSYISGYLMIHDI